MRCNGTIRSVSYFNSGLMQRWTKAGLSEFHPLSPQIFQFHISCKSISRSYHLTSIVLLFQWPSPNLNLGPPPLSQLFTNGTTHYAIVMTKRYGPEYIGYGRFDELMPYGEKGMTFGLCVSSQPKSK